MKIYSCITFLSTFLIAFSTPANANVSSHTLNNYFDLSIQELTQVNIDSIASLSPTAPEQDPAAVTTITTQDIEQSGARDVMELLEIFVPNVHYLRHHWEASHIGARGIISDRDDKYLLMVNGRVMNQQMHFGGLSERNLPMLNDISRIDVIRGAGSVVHGQGAVSMVINITTLTAPEADGTMVALQAAEGDTYQALEIRHGQNWSDTHNLLVYAGIAQQSGADKSDAPVVYGHSSTTTWGESIQAGEESQLNHPNDNANYNDDSKLKLHANYQFENFNVRARYTRSGETLALSPRAITAPSTGFSTTGNPENSYAIQEVGHQQFTVMANYLHTISHTLYATYSLSYDVLDNERKLFNYKSAGSLDPNGDRIVLEDEGLESSREEEYLVQARLNWQAHEQHLFSFGLDYGYEKWGSPSRLTHAPVGVSPVLGEMEPWSTDKIALLGEYQWALDEVWTSFLGIRADHDSYTKTMVSPRLAVIANANERDTYKLIFSRSSRKNFAEELRAQHLNNTESTPEILNSAEFIYQASWANWFAGSTIFYNDLDLIAFERNNLRSINIADQKTMGIELEAKYETTRWRIQVSHSYTKLLSFDLVDQNYEQGVSAADYGYGDDLSNWSNHISKLFVQTHVTPDWSIASSLRVFWGYDGAQDYSNYANDKRANTPVNDSIGLPSTALRDEGYDEPFGISAFWNINTAYTFNRYLKAQFDGYNLLGLFDKSYNKRMYYLNVSNYRAEAPTYRVKLTATY